MKREVRQDNPIQISHRTVLIGKENVGKTSINGALALLISENHYDNISLVGFYDQNNRRIVNIEEYIRSHPPTIITETCEFSINNDYYQIISPGGGNLDLINQCKQLALNSASTWGFIFDLNGIIINELDNIQDQINYILEILRDFKNKLYIRKNCFICFNKFDEFIEINNINNEEAIGFIQNIFIEIKNKLQEIFRYGENSLFRNFYNKPIITSGFRFREY
ncbi:MAG: hypothetical protein ACTSO2_07495, partial [Promethearchaeota archaeon]